jgi:very-short-patch-repair endonuclease
MLKTKEVKVKWEAGNKKHFLDLGYEFKWKSEFIVPVEHLSRNSHAMVDYTCDYCNKPLSTRWHVYLDRKENSVIKKDCCKECSSVKVAESNLINFGVTNLFQLEETKEKTRQTNLKKLGVEYPMQSENVKEKSKKACLEKYGVEVSSQSEIVKEKWKNNQFEKYGNYFTATEEYKEKKNKTCLEKYGEDNVMKNKNICYKQRVSMYKNSTAKCSRQQLYYYYIIGGELNFPIDALNLDIALVDDKINIEVDYSGHDLSVKIGSESPEEFNTRQKQRDYFLYRRGWKTIRLISKKDKVPTDEKILEMIEIAKEYLNSGHHWICFDIDNTNIKCSQYEKFFDFGQLRNITKNDIDEIKELEAI